MERQDKIGSRMLGTAATAPGLGLGPRRGKSDVIGAAPWSDHDPYTDEALLDPWPAAMSCRHQTCTAKMGQDAMSVVDGTLKVYGIEHLRIADGSIMPRVTTGNTMAPCVVIGERAGHMLKAEHGLDWAPENETRKAGDASACADVAA